jgi:predicted DNA-binding transcriptional regulator AlpA
MRLIRYPDLVAKGVVKSRMTLKRLIDDRGFPPGVLITPNARAWDEAEVDEWVKRRPAARKQWVRKFPDRHDPAGPHQKGSRLEEGDDDAQSKHRARRPRVIVDRLEVRSHRDGLAGFERQRQDARCPPQEFRVARSRK